MICVANVNMDILEIQNCLKYKIFIGPTTTCILIKFKNTNIKEQDIQCAIKKCKNADCLKYKSFIETMTTCAPIKLINTNLKEQGIKYTTTSSKTLLI